MTRVFSGIQPSGELHLGNYLGALRNWVTMQDHADTVYCIVDLHAITAGHDAATLHRRTLDMATGLLAAGVDPDKGILFVQSHVHEHAECAWMLDCVTGVGELERMPQYKEKAAKAEARGDSVSAGLLTYPVLQAADILLYHADEVPVGEDQRHHVELTRDIAQRFNHRFGDVFTLPRAVHPAAAARVMDLQQPDAKMSKSAESPRGTVLVLDEPKTVAKKIRSAVTDSGTDVRYDRAEKAGISNLLDLMAAATDRDITAIEDEYTGQGYGAFKMAVAEAVVELLRPVQARHRELAADRGGVEEALRAGAERARAVASRTLGAAKDAMGFLPPA